MWPEGGLIPCRLFGQAAGFGPWLDLEGSSRIVPQPAPVHERRGLAGVRGVLRAIQTDDCDSLAACVVLTFAGQRCGLDPDLARRYARGSPQPFLPAPARAAPAGWRRDGLGAVATSPSACIGRDNSSCHGEFQRAVRPRAHAKHVECHHQSDLESKLGRRVPVFIATMDSKPWRR